MKPRTNIMQKQKGLTLVEIMIAMVIGLVIMGGVIKIYTSSKAAYNLQSGMSRMHENARFALDILSMHISMAGYTQSITAAYGISSTNSKENESVNSALGFTKENLTASDVIEVSYQAPTDCAGNATSGVAINRFYISNTDLVCLGNGSVTPEVMIEGVENLQILYGEDTDNDDVINRYVSASNVTLWNSVKSVRIAILVNTVQNISSKDRKQYALLNTPPVGPITDGRGHRVFSRTILLRNPIK